MNFKKGVYFSFIAHVAVILFMIVKVTLFPTQEINFAEAIRVDMVGLPEKYDTNTLPEKIDDPAKLEEKKLPEKVTEKTKAEDKKAKEKVPDTIKIDKAKNKQKEALDKLKKMSAIEKIKQDVQNEEKRKQENEKLIKGQVISKGTALTGLAKIQSNEYLSRLDQRIKTNWQLPQWLIGKPLKTKILLKIKPNGEIADRQIYQSSGNPTYDEYSLLAVDKSAPFPPVPEKFTEVFKEDGVIIGFPE